MKTHVVKAGDIEREWFVVDAQGQNLGRLATRIAHILRGKHKPTFTPGLDVGDFVIVVNAGQVAVTGNKLEDKKYYRYSGYPGGLSETKLATMLARHRSVADNRQGMLPRASWGEDVQEAQGVCWRHASASGAAAQAARSVAFGQTRR